jgi:hypothetical protein
MSSCRLQISRIVVIPFAARFSARLRPFHWRASTELTKLNLKFIGRNSAPSPTYRKPATNSTNRCGKQPAGGKH